jgi:type IV pilus assembly protein PilO
MRFGSRELIFLLLLIAMPVASYFFVFQPRNQQIAEARQQIERKQEKLKQLQKTTQSIESLGREIEKLSEAIEMFEKKLPAQRQVEVVLEEVWKLASKHELTPNSVRTDQIVPAAQYAELPLNMEITGDFDGFYSFLIDLEKLPRVTQTPRMELERIDTENTDGEMQARLVLSIFFESASDQEQAKASRS